MGSNNLSTTGRALTFGEFLSTTGTKTLIQSTLGDLKQAQRFAANILSAVAVNPALQKCTHKTILSGAFLGSSLNLTPSPQLGQFYLVPFDKKDKDGNVLETNAVFVLGYKGYIQLALRSGYYSKINAIPVKESELIKWDPFTEEFLVAPILDDNKRDVAPTIGYYAMFEYNNGFKKAMYWSKAKMILHADRFSPAFNKDRYKLYIEGKIPQKDLWKCSSFWYKEFDDMALKTMLRQLISKWGIMSVDLQAAFEADEHTITDPVTLVPDADGVYNEPEPVPEADEEPTEFKESAKKGEPKQTSIDEA